MSTTTSSTNNSNGNAGPVNIAQPNKPSLVGSAFSEMRAISGDGAKLYVDGARVGRDILKQVYENVIKPYAPILGGVAAVGTAGAISVATLGVGGATAAAGYLLYGGATVAAGVAFTGAAMRVGQWLHGGYNAMSGFFSDRLSDAKIICSATKAGVVAALDKRQHDNFERVADKINLRESNIEADVLGHLDKVASAQTGQAAKEIVNQVKTGAKEILQTFGDRLSDVMARAQDNGVGFGAARKQIQAFQNHLADELKQNILERYAVSNDENPAAELASQLEALLEKAQQFEVKKGKVQLKLGGGSEVEQEEGSGSTEAESEGLDSDAASTGPQQPQSGPEPSEAVAAQIEQEQPSAPAEDHPQANTEVDSDASPVLAEPQPAPESAFARYFGSHPVPEDVEKALSALTPESTEQEKQGAVKLIQKELKHAEVTLEPGDTSPVAEVIKRASIPADRDIPHFKDLYRQLSEKFPDDRMELRNENGSEYIAISKGHRTIFLENRHKELGGKVTVYFQQKVNGNWEDVEQGGMWNDKVEAVVEKFLSSRTGEYPRLKSETASSYRIVDKVLTADQAAKALFSELENESSVKLELRAGGKMTVGATTIFVRRAVAGDSRMWKILDAEGRALAEGIAIKDLKEKILAQR